MITTLWVVGSIVYVLAGVATAARMERSVGSFNDIESLLVLMGFFWPVTATILLLVMFYRWVRDL